MNEEMLINHFEELERKSKVTQEQIDELFNQSEQEEIELWGKEYHLFIKLPNGFTVDGKGACVSPENYDREIGRKVAIEQIKNKLWELEGYLLQQKLFEKKNSLMKSCQI